MSEENLFKLALDLPEGDLATFLDRECLDDAALRERVEALLTTHLTPTVT